MRPRQLSRILMEACRPLGPQLLFVQQVEKGSLGVQLIRAATDTSTAVAVGTKWSLSSGHRIGTPPRGSGCPTSHVWALPDHFVSVAP